MTNFRQLLDNKIDFVTIPNYAGCSSVGRAKLKIRHEQAATAIEKLWSWVQVPFVPGQGTQRMSRDRCTIKINTIDGDNGDFDMEWLLDQNITDHC